MGVTTTETATKTQPNNIVVCDILGSIYTNKRWGKGIGTQALKLWIDHIFNHVHNFEHIGLTTWSGNHRMMLTAEKIGMLKEAHIRKVRFHNNTYYDSLSYGILREEWQEK